MAIVVDRFAISSAAQEFRVAIRVSVGLDKGPSIHFLAESSHAVKKQVDSRSADGGILVLAEATGQHVDAIKKVAWTVYWVR